MTKIIPTSSANAPAESTQPVPAVSTPNPLILNGLQMQTFSATEGLRPLLAEWTELGRNVDVRNIFYEPDYFLTATRHLSQDPDWKLLTVRDAETEQLVGFFPFVCRTGPGWLREFSLWKSPFSFLTTPLIRSGFESVVFPSVFHWIQTLSPRVDFVDFPMNLAAGRVYQELQSVIRDNLLTRFQYDHYSRALLQPQLDYESYLRHSIGGHHFREFNRQWRQLSTAGQLEFRRSREVKSASCWGTWFLDLEEKGWKGEKGTAMQQHPEQAAFFRDLLTTGMKHDTLELAGLFLNGEPIALACTLLSPPGGYAYKITFDENYRKFSPGMLLELELTKRFIENKELSWIDSCAVPNHPMINRLWSERRSIEHTVVSTGRTLPNLILATFPLLRAIKRCCISKSPS